MEDWTPVLATGAHPGYWLFSENGGSPCGPGRPRGVSSEGNFLGEVRRQQEYPGTPRGPCGNALSYTFSLSFAYHSIHSFIIIRSYRLWQHICNFDLSGFKVLKFILPVPRWLFWSLPSKVTVGGLVGQRAVQGRKKWRSTIQKAQSCLGGRLCSLSRTPWGLSKKDN